MPLQICWTLQANCNEIVRVNLGLNLAANFAGQGWRACMSVLLVPFYIRILGIEAYGLIGLYASLQITLALLDAGLRPTLAREMARFTAGASDALAIRTLLRSVEWPLAAMAAAILAIMLLCSPWLSAHWITADRLSPAAVTQALQLMGLVAGLQLLEAAYDSCLNGLQRQVLQNAVITGIATLRGFGALIVLWFSPTLTAFFAWQAAVALLSCLLLRLVVHRSLPPATGKVVFSLAALRSIRRYAAGMFGIAVLSLLLTQSDKLVLPRFVPLSAVGHYTLAATLTGAVAMLSGPIGNTFLPRLTQLVQSGNSNALSVTFHRVSSLMTVAVGSAAAILIVFGERIIALWVNDANLAAGSAPILALLAIAGLLNAITSLPYMLQLANGVTGLTLRINLGLLVVFLPLLFFAVSIWGVIGAAASAVGMSLAGMISGASLTFRRFLRGDDAADWWMTDVMGPLVMIFLAAAAMAAMAPRSPSAWFDAIYIVTATLLVFLAGMLANRNLRRSFFAYVKGERIPYLNTTPDG